MRRNGVLLRCSGPTPDIGSAAGSLARSDRSRRSLLMDLFGNPQDPWTWQGVLLATAILLVLLAVLNHLAARQAERRNPPKGSFLEVDGVRLHYSDRGTGRPIVLIHGNAVTGGDYNTSGVAERLVRSYRVIVFDRPGFGYSERPLGRLWIASAQADLLHQALVRLD